MNTKQEQKTKHNKTFGKHTKQTNKTRKREKKLSKKLKQMLELLAQLAQQAAQSTSTVRWGRLRRRLCRGQRVGSAREGGRQVGAVHFLFLSQFCFAFLWKACKNSNT